MHEWEEYYCRGYGRDPDIVRERSMFNPFDALPDEPFFYTNTCHPLDFSCQCKICVRMHTITMKDREFLDSIGIVWNDKAIVSTPSIHADSKSTPKKHTT